MTIIEWSAVIIAAVHVCSGAALIFERAKSILHKRWIEREVEELKASIHAGANLGGLAGAAIAAALKHFGAAKDAHVDPGHDQNGKDNGGRRAGATI